jgi:hypothetical protein
MPKGTHQWVVVYSERFGAPYAPVHFSNDKAELEKWLDQHKAQYVTGHVEIRDGAGYEHDVAADHEAPKPVEAP